MVDTERTNSIHEAGEAKLPAQPPSGVEPTSWPPGYGEVAINLRICTVRRRQTDKWVSILKSLRRHLRLPHILKR